jgi:hypothetical protein
MVSLFLGTQKPRLKPSFGESRAKTSRRCRTTESVNQPSWGSSPSRQPEGGHTNRQNLQTLKQNPTMRLLHLVTILVLCASTRIVESRLHDPEFSRSLAFEGEDVESVTAFSPNFIPAFISAEDGCPPHPSDANCTLEYVPITCNKCPYSHSCLADAALEDLDTFECLIAPSTPDGPEYGELGLPNDPACPLPDDDAPCTFDFVPLKCNGCIYILRCCQLYYLPYARLRGNSC